MTSSTFAIGGHDSQFQPSEILHLQDTRVTPAKHVKSRPQKKFQVFHDYNKPIYYHSDGIGLDALHEKTDAVFKKANMTKENRIKELEEQIAALKRQWPAHSVPATLLQQLEDLEDELELERKTSDPESPDG